jgi:glutamate-1-semialdehyde 2,1-aminomutase/spore coat polysaccharide biosynthesis protein SpsF
MEKYKGQVAGIILTPLAHEFNHPIEFPKDGFLQKLRDITKAEGSLLIYDEVRTGFRLALGGAQEYFGVTPDIGVFGKAMANGYAIGMVTGRDDIMMANQKAYISSTFFYNSFPMTASLATINEIREKNVIPHIWRLGEKLQKGMRDLLEKYEIPAEVSGPPPMPFLSFKSDAQKRHQERRRIFYTEAIANGVFLHPFHHWYIFFTHTDKDIETTLDVIEKTMMKIKKEVG